MQCPNDTSTYDEGSTNLTACTIKCPAGQENDGTETCRSCPDDEFKSEASFGDCQPCTGDLTSSHSNRTACTIRFCDVGREDKSDTCSDCLEGFYKSQRGNMECTNCPGNKTTSSRAATSMSECTVELCKLGQYRDFTNICQDCSPDFFQNEPGQTTCIQCPVGYMSLQARSTEASSCKSKCVLSVQNIQHLLERIDKVYTIVTI
ncbi:signal peptide, cub and egf-like domain-containing protein 1 [Plakobranchus ocellatus]|uniref:Signal peptide, cub and egf-like domain-containing protein 1 n=1 Tax=Plakobranchus ocellatus TaxID=259542 RepID=A0AAV3ZSC8_9GAST|nr:signal peptide, cub and egf-like domain-containing protein 1 [Plakobranchus ocellatus]